MVSKGRWFILASCQLEIRCFEKPGRAFGRGSIMGSSHLNPFQAVTMNTLLWVIYINDSYLFLSILEKGKSKIKVLTNLVSSEGPVLHWQCL